ncbi:MAG: ABC transporter ATP-binding protein [Acidobacteriota bacterium]
MTARGVRKHFGSLVAVDGVDLDIGAGEVFGFLGPNGAGKSTLIRMLVGLMRPSAGSIQVLGLDLPRQAEALRPKLGYMTQRFSLYDDLSVRENLEFAAEVFGFAALARRARVDETLQTYGLEQRVDQRPATLSGGWRQRLALAVATIHRPPLLLLDEPTAGVDPSTRRLFWARLFEIAADGTTILVSTHYMDEAVRCHRLCLLLRGRRVALGAPGELMDALDGRVLEVRTGRVAAAIDVLEHRPEAASVAQMGDRAHVLLRPEAPSAHALAPALERLLHEHGFADAAVRPEEASLEDVFVAATGGERLSVDEDTVDEHRVDEEPPGAPGGLAR